MTLRGGLVAAVLLLPSCGNGPIFPVEDALYSWVTAPESIEPASDRAPEIRDDIVRFSLAPGERRSALRTAEDWRITQTRMTGFDVLVDPSALGKQQITLSRIYRRGDPAAEIVSVLLDADRGVTVLGRQCIAPEALGSWHRIEIRIRLRDDDKGFLEVFCDRNPVWARTAIRTTLPPVCRRSEGCSAAVPQPVRYEWQVGVMADRPVSAPVSVQMQRLHHRVLFFIPNRPGTL